MMLRSPPSLSHALPILPTISLVPVFAYVSRVSTLLRIPLTLILQEPCMGLKVGLC